MDIPHAQDAAAPSSQPHSRQADEPARHAEPRPAPSESARELATLIRELKEYVLYFLIAKTDGVKASFRHYAIKSILRLIGLVALASAIAVGVALLLLGAAGGIAAALGGNLWLGGLIVGAVILLCVGLGIYVTVGQIFRSMRARTVKKYEQRQNWQRARFGRDVGDAAAKNQ